jgi:hypothetical protein
MIQKYAPVEKIHKVSVGHGAGTFRIGYGMALDFPDDDIVYFLENDYLHRKNSAHILQEGFALNVAEYITLYDHPSVYDGTKKQKCFLFLGKNTYWKFSGSTTMTFAARVKTLRRDWKYFDRWTRTTHPYDFQIFTDLHLRGRRLILPIPGYSTHGETKVLSPLVDWEKEIVQ